MPIEQCSGNLLKSLAVLACFVGYREADERLSRRRKWRSRLVAKRSQANSVSPADVKAVVLMLGVETGVTKDWKELYDEGLNV